MITRRLITYVASFYFCMSLVSQNIAQAQSSLQDATDACIRISSLVASGDSETITFNEGQVRVTPTGQVQIYRGDSVTDRTDFNFVAVQDCVLKFMAALGGGSGNVVDLAQCREITGQDCPDLTDREYTVTQMLDANHPSDNHAIFGFSLQKACRVTLSFREGDKLGFGFFIELQTANDSQLINTLLGNQRLQKTTEVGEGVYYLHMVARARYGNDGSGLKRVTIQNRCFS